MKRNIFKRRKILGAILGASVVAISIAQAGGTIGTIIASALIGAIIGRIIGELIIMVVFALFLRQKVQTGMALLQQGQPFQALQKLQAALAYYQMIGVRASEGTTLNNIGGVYETQGRYGKALESLQQALTIHREVGNRTEEGTTLNNIGKVYEAQGRYREALDSFQQALVIHREAGKRAGEGTILNNIGKVYEAWGRYDEALHNFQQALTIHREAGDRLMEGTILNNIGRVYHVRGRYGETLDSFQQALIIHREVGNRAGEGATLNNIGGVCRVQGRYDEALDSFQQALVIHREVGTRPIEGTILDNIGKVYRVQGRYGEALDSYQQALTIHREVGNRAGEGTTLNNIGGVYLVQGRYGEALDNFQQALTIYREVDNRTGEGVVLDNIGKVYNAQGHYVEAFDSFQRALIIHREVGNRPIEGTTLGNIGAMTVDEALYQQALTIHREVGNRAGEGTTLSNIGGMYLVQGRYDEAIDSFQQALTIHQEVGDRLMEGTTLTSIGTVYEAQGRYPKAFEAFQQGMDLIETIRATAGSEQARTNFIAQYADLYARTVSLYHQQSQDEQAFFTSERGRARAFLDSLSTGQVTLSDNEVADLIAQEQEAYVQRQAIQDELIKVRSLDPPDPELVTNLEARLSEAEAAYAEVLAAIEARGDQLAALVPGRSTVLGLSEVQGLLDEQITLLSYFVLPDQTLVFLITRQRFEVIEVDVSGENLANRIGYLYQLLPFRQLDATRQAAQELYQLLIAPLVASLHTPRLALVPRGPLHYLAFAALLDPDTDQYLVEQYTLVSLPSASTLPFIQENSRKQKNGDKDSTPALVVGNPTFEADLPPLRFAEQEAQAIADLYSVEPLLGAAAAESTVRERVGQANILHLAAHGAYNPYNPLYSTIFLAPDKAQDGRLEVHEIYGLDLKNADLVVLSACETQLGDLSAGDELVGLTRAFLFAGTPTIIASLWRVEDEATAILMERFYRHLRVGLGKAAALRQAQLDMFDNYPDPYYWAGFVLSGDGGE